MKYRGYITIGMYVDLESENPSDAKHEGWEISKNIRKQIDSIKEVKDADTLDVDVYERRFE